MNDDIPKDAEKFRPMVYATPADKDCLKAYPNGIRVTFAAIWQRWAYVEKRDIKPKTSAAEFSEIYKLRELGADLYEQYPFSPGPPAATKSTAAGKVAGEEFQKFGGSKLTDSKSLNLSYMTLRRAASVVQLPVGLFLLFTNLVSQERRSHKKIADKGGTTTKAELLELVQKIEKFASEARRIIDESEGGDIFYKSYGPGEWLNPSKNAPRTNEEVYIADMEVLKRLRDACRSSRVDEE